MERLVHWNCKEVGSALPLPIDELGNTVPLEDICAQLATIYDIIGDCDLALLRDLLLADEDGRCFLSPVKPGETIYMADPAIFGNRVIEARVIDITFGSGNPKMTVQCCLRDGGSMRTMLLWGCWEKTVYRTYVAAYAALKGDVQ